MSANSLWVRFVPVLVVLFPAPAFAANAPRVAVQVQSDLAPSETRQAALDLAAHLSHPSEPPPMAAGLKTPFDFDKTEPDPTSSANGVAPTPAQGTRDILEAVADQIRPGGVFIRGNDTLLVFSQGKPSKVGTKFTVTLADGTYEVELVAITSTSFTLRYKDEETTRPITPKK